MLAINRLLEVLQDIASTPLRSLLTVTGIVVGIAAVIIVMAIGEGNRTVIQDRIKSLGTNLMALNLSGASGAGGFVSGLPVFIDEKRLKGLPLAIPAVKAISPVINITVEVKFRNIRRQIDSSAVYSSYPEVRNIKMSEGRFFSSLENEKRRYVVVISESAAKEFGVSKKDINQSSLTLNNKNYLIIGISRDLPSFESAVSQKQVFIPYQRLMEDWPAMMLTDAFIKVSDEADVALVSEKIKTYLTRHYGEDSQGWLKGMTDMLQAEKAITTQTTMVIVGIASLSLLVGGIGIMNIMLVMVKEKTREIGLRKAIGATEKDIMLQFLGEGVVLCVLGGLIGVLLGVIVSTLVAEVMGMPTIISISSIVVSLIFSCLVGVFFTLYPAIGAAKLSPVEALRYE